MCFMALQAIQIGVRRRVATVTLNRPDRGNAFDQIMLDELGGQFAALGADEAVRLVVLRGAGRHFCTGADLRAPRPPADEPGHLTLRDVLAALDALQKPTLALIHGGAIGGGATLAACCDVVIAADDAFFSIPEVRVGIPPLGVAPFLIRAIGHRAFRRYGLSGERIAAAEAMRIGLAHEICPAGQLDETLARIADELLLGAPGAIATLKRAAAAYASPPLEQILADRAQHDPHSPEAREGVASFREKRKPSWYPQE
jgi:methylglutaconyl-CoA hydratase